MANVRRVSMRKVDSYIPQSALCMRCQTAIDETSAHYGRIIANWVSGKKEDIRYKVHNGSVHAIPEVTETFFPKKVTGFCCPDCYAMLYAESWRDSSGHLRRAFETVSREVIQPKGDDHEASPILKGLYAPHVVKSKGQRKADYFETATQSSNSVIIPESALPKEDRKLQGFNRFDRDDIKIDPAKRKVIAKGGNWKVKPEEYNYKAQEPVNKPKLSTKRMAPQDAAALKRIDDAMKAFKSPFAEDNE